MSEALTQLEMENLEKKSTVSEIDVLDYLAFANGQVKLVLI